ncbi:unnamed protein product [Symbiodinium natans]|uniref:Uncharacterized protein n=1 Tax=Symbiodinium natans TaxID=878477 RepID=A0A812T602_9DINO|nr:unnamed protein product [Symbiodinium natans]
MHADAGRMASDLSQRAVFRAASGLAVLSGGGRVWSSDGADYFQEAEVTNHVDVFVSHSWAADRWMKHLAMCYFLNFGLSVKVTLAAVLLSQGIFFIYPEQSISTLFVLVMDFPVLAFFLAFFFGQHLTCGRWCPSLWVDKLCIDQTDESAKQRGIASVPTTVSNSSELLVLWDETYFQRLWCNLELSIFARRRGVKHVLLVPLWLAPWLLSTMLLLYLEGRLMAIMWSLNPKMGIDVNADDAQAATNVYMYGFQHMLDILEAAPFYALLYLPMIPVSLTAFQAKLDGHATLLADMESFDIRDAKCSVEEDRQAIEMQVAELFSLESSSISRSKSTDSEDAAEETSILTQTEADLPAPAASRSPQHEQCLNSFNLFVRGSLRDAIIDDWGLETHLPWHICLLAWLPTMLCLTAVSWCAIDFYEEMGFTSQKQYLLVAGLELWVCYPICLPLAHPWCLRSLRCVSSTQHARKALLALCCAGVFVVVEAAAELLTGSIESFAFTAQPAFLAIFVLIFVLTMQACYMTFSPDAGKFSSRGLLRG